MKHFKSIPELTQETKDKFWLNIDIKSKDDCWEWIGGKDKEGYGQFCTNGTIYKAHRVSYFLTFGEIPDGLLICHKCNNPNCVNPSHLYAGTDKDNARDSINAGTLHKFTDIRGEKHPLFGKHLPEETRKKISLSSKGFKRSAKLTPNQVMEIRYLLTQDLTLREIGERFNTSLGNVSTIKRNLSWIDIPLTQEYIDSRC